MLGNTHPDIAFTMFNIALVRYDRGDATGAIDGMRKTLEMLQEMLGADHPDVVTSALSLGLWLREAGAFAEAVALLAWIPMKPLGPNIGASAVVGSRPYRPPGRIWR